MNGKRCKLTLTRSQVSRIQDWAAYNAIEALTDTEADVYETIERECQKALAYNAERRTNAARTKP